MLLKPALYPNCERKKRRNICLFLNKFQLCCVSKDRLQSQNYVTRWWPSVDYMTGQMVTSQNHYTKKVSIERNNKRATFHHGWIWFFKNWETPLNSHSFRYEEIKPKRMRQPTHQRNVYINRSAQSNSITRHVQQNQNQTIFHPKKEIHISHFQWNIDAEHKSLDKLCPCVQT